MTRVAALCLLLAACADDAPGAVALAQASCPPCTCVETQLVDAIHEHAPELGVGAFPVALERESDGRRITLTTGGHPYRPEPTASTAKPVAVAVILRQVELGHLRLDDRIVDVLPGFAAEGPQVDVTLRHLVTFTAVMTASGCWYTNGTSTTWAEYEACVLDMPNQETARREPGVSTIYNAGLLDIAGQAATVAAGASDWEQLFDEWRTHTGLLPGATWNRSYPVCASREFLVPAGEYLAFLSALADGTAVDPRLAAWMMSDSTPWPHGRTPAYQMFVDGGHPGEDWHFGAGLWQECAAPDWTCSDHASPPRVTTFGVGGQLGVIGPGWRIYIGPTWASSSGGHYLDTVPWLRTHLETLLDRWAMETTQ